jgi:tRNA U34 5-carboxymethylaminomethyl modifying enzyme MnmG/GidA
MESASHGLTENLQLLGFETDRLKTSTPPRIDRRTVDFSGLEPQHGDEEVCILLAAHHYPLGFLHLAKFSAYID